MITRRIVQSGLSSNVISLPKDFIKDNKLKKGDTVYLERQGSTKLLVSSKGHDAKKPKNIKVINVNKRPMRVVEKDFIRAYLKNYSEIVIKLDNSSQAKDVKKFVNYMVAVEVVHEDGEKIIAKDFLNYKDTDAHKLLVRVEHIVHSMFIDLKEVDKDDSIVEVIYDRDYEVNRLVYMIMRILSTAADDPETAEILNVKKLQLVRMWSVNNHLEKIGDEIKRISRIIPQLKKLKYDKKKFYAFLDQVIDLYRNTFKAINSENFDLMDTNMLRRKKISNDLSDYASKNLSYPLFEIIGIMKGALSHLVAINKLYRFIGYKTTD